MKDYNFTIKVGDLLQDPSWSDRIEFTKKFSTFLPQVITPWISAIIDIEWMDRQTVLLHIDRADAPCEVDCDICWNNMTTILHIEDIWIKCFFEDTTDIVDNEDDILYISPQQTVIDIEKYLCQSLLLSQAVVNMCTKCQKNNNTQDDKTHETHSDIVWK